MDVVGIIVFLVLVVVIVAAVSAGLAGGHPQPRVAALALAGAVLGGFGGSEWFGSLSDWGPTVDGLNVLPAIVSGVVISTLAALSGIARGSGSEAQHV